MNCEEKLNWILFDNLLPTDDTGGDGAYLVHYGYNPRSEVVAASIATNAYSYSYDSIGNSLHSACNAETNLYAANALNQYASVTGAGGAQSLSYDADGNLLTWNGYSLVWDPDNRLYYGGGGTSDFGFFRDWSGRAFSETENAYYTDRVFDGWNPVYERLVDGWTETPVSDTVYVWGTDLSGTMRGAGGVGGLLAVKRDGTWYVPLYDANGNVTAYVSETGAVIAEYEYDAFGATISQSGMMADSFRHRFSTKPWIAALGVYDYGERLYSPELRRWMSRDPIEEEGGVNLYAMCGNDAVNGVDPFGLKKVIKNCCTDEDIRAKLTEKLLEADRLSYSNAIRIVIHGTGIYKRNSQTYKYYREYSGYICCKDGKVSSTGPYPGAYRFNIGGVEREIEDTKELKKYLAKVEIGSISMGGIPTSGNVELNAKCQCPKGSKAIVFYHTHPEPNSFSASDRQWFRSGRRIGFALYSHGLDYIELAEWGNPLIRIPLKTKGL